MKSLAFIFFATIIATTANASTVDISFDNLMNNNTYFEDGFRFDGMLGLNSNFSSSPALRIYGNVPLTISRVDGNSFSMDSLNLLFRYDQYHDWWISNERGQGFQLSRSGEFLAGQFPTFAMQNVIKLTVFDPSWVGTDYYIFDDFHFSYQSPVPVPNSYLLFIAGIGLLIIRRRYA